MFGLLDRLKRIFLSHPKISKSRGVLGTYAHEPITNYSVFGYDFKGRNNEYTSNTIMISPYSVHTPDEGTHQYLFTFDNFHQLIKVTLVYRFNTANDAKICFHEKNKEITRSMKFESNESNSKRIITTFTPKEGDVQLVTLAYKEYGYGKFPYKVYVNYYYDMPDNVNNY